MAERRVFLNGIDLSRFVKDLKAQEPPGDWERSQIPGLKNVGPITISGSFDDNYTLRCGSCHEPYRLGEEGGQIVAHNLKTGERIQLCPACGVALLDGHAVNGAA